MIFQISPKLSVARDLSQTYRQTVPQTRPESMELQGHPEQLKAGRARLGYFVQGPPSLSYCFWSS